MAMTPEGWVKKGVRDLLDRYAGLYYEMPVPSGYGKATLDFIGCFRGVFFAIETKAGGKKPTTRQETTIENMRKAHAAVFIISGDGDETLSALGSWLNHIDRSLPHDPRLSPTPRARRPI